MFEWSEGSDHFGNCGRQEDAPAVDPGQGVSSVSVIPCASRSQYHHALLVFGRIKTLTGCRHVRYAAGLAGGCPSRTHIHRVLSDQKRDGGPHVATENLSSKGGICFFRRSRATLVPMKLIHFPLELDSDLICKQIYKYI